MKKYSLDFCFKGNRTYVQGPDIFDASIYFIKKEFDTYKINDIKYSAYEMLFANANLIITENFNRDEFNKINSIITFKIEDKKYYAIVVENDNKILCSVEYSEEVVQTESIIDDLKIVFINTLEYSLTELIVSMNKYFLQKTVTEDGKWIVTKFEYNNLVDIEDIKNKKLQLDLTNNFNNKLTRSIIKINDLQVGYLYFSLI